MRKLPFCRLPAVSALFVSVSLLQACSVDVDTREDAVAPMPVKVVVVAMFEKGEPRGDEAGELQLWVERLGLDTEIDFPLGVDVLYMNDDGVLAVLVGGGIPNATASIMALGLDDRFDLTQSYWLVAGIAGADPEDLSLGSAAWANHVVDGDLLYEIDGREIPEDWPYGMVPLGADRPTTDPDVLPERGPANTIAFTLNKDLVDWAYAVTKDVELEDMPGITAYRAHYATFPAAQRPPFVTIGDTMSSSTYWHGNFMNQWANDWIRLYRGADANFMTSNMEDSGTMTSLTRLGEIGRVDIDRVLVLRTASNFTMPPAGKTAVWSRDQPYPDDGKPSFEAAFVVGNTVVQALLEDWAEYKENVPKVAAE